MKYSLQKQTTSFISNAHRLWSLDNPLPVRKRQFSADGTQKLLLELDNGQSIGSASMPMPSTRPICLSIQVGCPIDHTFCRTGQSGFIRRSLGPDILAARSQLRSERNASPPALPLRENGHPTENKS